MSDQKVFWYYAGRRAASVVIEGVPTLASPHKFLLAPSGQKWPPSVAHLFKRKTPSQDILAQFGRAGALADKQQKEAQAAEARARREKAAAKKEKAAAARKGLPSMKLSMSEAIQEKGRATPPSPAPPAASESPHVEVETEDKGGSPGTASGQDGNEQEQDEQSSRSRRSSKR